MKYLISILAMTMMTATAMAQNGKASTIRKTFSRETSVSIDIQADPAIVWRLLTNAADYPRWNSTVTSIEGTIALGEKIRLKSTLDAKRTFKLKVKTFEVDQELAWGDSQGMRVYRLKNSGNGGMTFSMTEKIGGFMFPMYAKMIPSFDASFEQFASDLQQEAESIMRTK